MAEDSIEQSHCEFDAAPVVDKSALEDLRMLYEEQQRRLACPACGEEPFWG